MYVQYLCPLYMTGMYMHVEKHVVCAVVGVLSFIPPHLFHFKLDTSSSFSLIVSNGVKRSNTIKLIRWIGKDTNTSSLLYYCHVIITNVLGSESSLRPYEGALEKIFFLRINCKWCVNSALIVENCILYCYSAHKKQGGGKSTSCHTKL